MAEYKLPVIRVDGQLVVLGKNQAMKLMIQKSQAEKLPVETTSDFGVASPGGRVTTPLPSEA